MSPILILLEQQLNRLILPRRDERGLSQSTEKAILLIVITVITKFVEAKLPK